MIYIQYLNHFNNNYLIDKYKNTSEPNFFFRVFFLTLFFFIIVADAWCLKRGGYPH